MDSSEYVLHSKFNDKWSHEMKLLVRILSEDSRASVSDISKKLNVSRRTAKEKMKKIVNDLGIKFTIELDEEALGLSNPHLILVKFSKKPDYAHVATVLQQSQIPQLAVTINGNYDLFIYANAETTKDYVFWDKTVQLQLSKYGVDWHASDLAYKHVGFFPLKNGLIERLNIQKVYRDLLLLLNENSRMSFTEISKRLGMHFNTVAYNFKKLVKMGYIKRFTIVITSPENMSLMSLFAKYVVSEGFEDDSMAMRKEVVFMDDKMPIISRAVLASELVGSFNFFYMAAYDNDEIGFEKLIKYYKRRYRSHSAKVFYGTLRKVLFGNLPVRNLETKKEFNMIRWVPNATPLETHGAFAKSDHMHV